MNQITKAEIKDGGTVLQGGWALST